MSTDNSKSPGAQVHPPAQPPKSPSVAHPCTSQGSPSHNCLLLLLLSVFYVFLIFRDETCHAPLTVGKQTSPACARQEDVVMRHTQPELWSQEPPAQDLESICDQHRQHIPTDPVTALGAAKTVGTALLVRGLQLTSFHLTLGRGGPTAFAARAQHRKHHPKLRQGHGAGQIQAAGPHSCRELVGRVRGAHWS